MVRARPGIALDLRELPDGAVVEVRERTAGRTLRRGDLLLARLLGSGDGWMLGLVLSVPRAQRHRLLQVVAGGASALCDWLVERDAPRLANTERHELLLLEQRRRVSETP